MLNVAGIKSPIDDALLAAMYGGLCSAVYSALNDAHGRPPGISGNE
jgi:hypothetical protein